MADEILIETLSVDGEGIHVAFKDGRGVTAPLTRRLEGASPTERDRWVLVGHGVGVHWPDLDEDLSAEGLWHDNQPEHPPLLRRCLLCGGETRWNSERCDSCGKERWNDPDDTKLGRELGKMERTNYATAKAAAKLQGLADKFMNALVDASLSGELDEEAIDADLRRMTGREQTHDE